MCVSNVLLFQGAYKSMQLEFDAEFWARLAKSSREQITRLERALSDARVRNQHSLDEEQIKDELAASLQVATELHEYYLTKLKEAEGRA